jgi:hypothetical protein
MAAKRKTEKPLYAFIRRNNGLYPEMLADARALEGVAQGERVRVEIKQWRNLDRHRAYWAMLSDVVAATDCALTPERLHNVLKLELGVVDLVRLPNGMTVALPGSINFDSMPEAEFVVFLNRATEWLAANYGYVNERAAA